MAAVVELFWDVSPRGALSREVCETQVAHLFIRQQDLGNRV